MLFLAGWYLALSTVGCCLEQQISFRWADRTPSPLSSWQSFAALAAAGEGRGAAVFPPCCAPRVGAIPWHNSPSKSLIWRRGKNLQRFAYASPNSWAGSSKLDMWNSLLCLKNEITITCYTRSLSISDGLKLLMPLGMGQLMPLFCSPVCNIYFVNYFCLNFPKQI